MKYLVGFVMAILLIGIIALYKNESRTPEDFMVHAIQNGSKRLDQFIRQEGLNREDFIGPYLSKDDYNPRGETYTACYKSNTHHFCYYQGSYNSQGYKYDGNCGGHNLCEWLEKQP